MEVILKNLPTGLQAEELRDLLVKVGCASLLYVKVYGSHWHHVAMRGTAFAQISSRGDAERAVIALEGTVLRGKTIIVRDRTLSLNRRRARRETASFRIRRRAP